MCGIAGFVGTGTRKDLEHMTRAISYRGPDGEGYFFDEHAGVGLGHRRLAIIDLYSGAQPIYNEDKTVAVIFNGEIYNFEEVRKTLASKHTFTTKTDTEVIAHLYEEKGESLFPELSGMFAIALFDSKRQKILLARDRLGKKPLYFGVFGGTLIFGSELKALIQHPMCKRELNMDALNHYFALDYVPTPQSIWEGICKLPPASYLTFEKKETRIETFWRPKFEEERINFPAAVSELDRRLTTSVRKRLVADVTLGVFLSGGIDSTAIAYYAQKERSTPIETFSIGFNEKSFDESAYARLAARHLGTNHHEAMFTAKDMLDCLPEVFNLLDEPMADPSLLPTYLLSAFTRKRVTVALGGDGGDELFAGYPTFQAERLAGWYASSPAFFKRLIEAAVRRLPIGHDLDFSARFKAERFLEGLAVEPRHRHARWLGSFADEERRLLFTKEAREAFRDMHPYAGMARYKEEAAAEGASLGNALLYGYLRTYLMDQVLVKVDRASMWNALEVRAPFLDEELVDFAQSLPYDFKCNGWRTKRILKELMKGKIPFSILHRPKKGFGIPLAKWLREELREFALDVLSESEIKRGGLFEPRYVQRILAEHQGGKKNHRKLLWPLLVFQMWRKRWGTGV